QVLIVDDSSTVRVQLQIALDRLGLGWASASSAAEAMEQLESRSFDLALVDVVMPDSDGYKLTREIKRDPRWRRMPVIILTSRSSPFDLARGALAGCDAYLSKPVPFRALQQALVNQLRKSLRIDDLSALMRLSDDSKQPEQAGSRLSRVFGR
ncbi:MAG: response regulator, partial [Quisquiliibacterium sp.]